MPLKSLEKGRKWRVDYEQSLLGAARDKQKCEVNVDELENTGKET